MSPRRQMRRCDWVVVGPEPHLAHCTRCGGVIEKPTLPSPFEMVIAWMNAGVKMHSRCKPTEALVEGPPMPREL